MCNPHVSPLQHFHLWTFWHYNPDNDLASGGFGHDLDYSLNKQKYEKIINDPEYHFENTYVTNFDLIHHQCRGDKLKGNKKDYETISKQKVNEEI